MRKSAVGRGLLKGGLFGQGYDLSRIMTWAERNGRKVKGVILCIP